MESDINVIKSAYNKTQDQVYFIQPCIDPKTGMYPPCVREEEDTKTHKMILSEDDKKFLSKGGVLLPATKPIKVQHGMTFDMNDKLQKAQWEAIQYSSFVTDNRFSKDASGNYVIDGERPYVTETGVVRGRYGTADLYVEHPGIVAKNKNEVRKKILQAQNLITQDTIDGWITKCRLLEKNMAHANVNDIEDYLFTQAEKYPDKIIELYTGNTTSIRLLIISAIEKNVLVKRNGLLFYADDVVIGSNMDSAVAFLSQPENMQLKELIQKETFPELYKSDKVTVNEEPVEEPVKSKKK